MGGHENFVNAGGTGEEAVRLLAFLSVCLFICLLSMIANNGKMLFGLDWRMEEVPIQANHESVKPLHSIALGRHVE